MSALQPLCHLIEMNPCNLSKIELLLLEADLMARVCKELKDIFRKQYKNYFNLMKFNLEKENTMLEANFIRFLIQDILSTDEYTVTGIALYTDTHEEVIEEIITGCNTRPSAILLQRMIELHREVKRELYCTIMKKVAEEYLAAA